MAGRKFGLPSDQRRALLKGLVRALIIDGKIQTTETRAKDARSIAEKMVTRAKQNTLHARRICRQYLDDESVIQHLFDRVAPRFRDRPGGYTRMAKVGVRRGDGAPLVLLELAND
jgi:large subunit ribosomal protein L17